MMKLPIDWLLEGEPWVVYQARRDLLGASEGDPLVQSARAALLQDPRMQVLLADLSAWPGTVISSHKSAGQPFHKLTFLADLGLNRSDSALEIIIHRILSHQSDEGPFTLSSNIPQHYGGTGMDLWAWALCDAPLTVYALVKFGLQNDPAVKKAISYLTGLIRDNGWPCAVSKELGSFRGPGRKVDPCPYATLVMLKLLSALDDLRDSPACQTGAETLLHLWSESLTQHPYIFYMGTDFRKLKLPFIWYDLLHVLEVLSRFPWLKHDPRLLDMLSILKGKMDPGGRFTIESVWTAWKDWEFGQKKVPSRWLTLSAWRIINRLEG